MSLINANTRKISFKHVLPSFLSSSLSIFSHTFMIFVNRIFLSYYSLDAMNAVSAISLVYVTLVFASMNLVAIAEVFIGQYNGSRQYQYVGSAIWQVIYLGLLVWLLIFVPISLYGYRFMIPDILMEHGKVFFQIMLLGCGITIPLMGIASAFFMGIGKPRVIIAASLIGNIVTIPLDILLIFGIDGVFEGMGSTGSAIATVIGTIITIAILFAVAFGKANVKKYKLFNTKLDLKLMLQCWSTGLPNALTHICETAAFAFITYKIATLGLLPLTINNIVSNVFILFVALPEGVYKSCMPIVANLIGARKYQLIPQTIKVYLSIICIVMLPILLISVIYPEIITALFLPFGLEGIEYDTLISYVRWSFVGLSVYIFIYTLSWLFFGVTSAGGDTKFITIVNTLCLWLFMVAPCMLILDYVKEMPFLLWVTVYPAYAIPTMLIAYYRYKSNKWRRLEL